MKDVLGTAIGFGDYVLFISNSGFRFGRVVGVEAARPPYRLKNPPVPFIRLKVQGLRTAPPKITTNGPIPAWQLQQSYLTASGRVIRVVSEQVPVEQRDELTRLMGW